MSLQRATSPEWLTSPGLVPYPFAIATMRDRVAAIRAGQACEQVWLVEHPPLYTAGTSAQPADLTEPKRFETFNAGRGGQWTYHGPGQLVAYVMLDLNRPHGSVAARDTHAYVEGLQAWLAAALAMFGVCAETRLGRVGLWVPRSDSDTTDDKIAAIGVRITRWVSWHGVALNICPKLEHFSGIIPCGIRTHGVTSLQALGLSTTLDEAARALRESWPTIFG